ncbi:alternate-type signal peptide domain-containing protein [Arthrobacter sp. zg-Y769]|uniref:alternate-type signal peptide domain-containing protein n=1 Tax=Arthrobacter sp. zg-Y769 TaxID=2894191 RepID=UPI001E2DE914|nr:alternate-type signal peptide domain-containing protein [Arthrobacter sp. zg-Y769]MCC9205448.1 alternate-type signal peptide domain-containing protein [Arthrobacter sp. zg-Y769]
MNKMTKGALSIGFGAALLLGGGGTLAVWNQTVDTNAGTIAAGDLGLTAGTGTWTSNGTPIKDINSYKIVPGETLTYSQPLTVDLKGDKMQANVKVNADGILTGDFITNDLKLIEPPTLTNSAGAVLPTTVLTPTKDEKPQTVTASVSFKFDASAKSSTNATANLNNVSYTLEQKPVTK